MHVFLDNKALRSQPTFAAALRAGVDEAARGGRVVVEALVDGAAVADSILESPPEESIGAELRLTSVEPTALVRVTLQDAADALDKAREDQGRSAELIQTGRVEDAMPPLQSALRTWQAVREAVEKSAALIHVPLETMESPAGERGTERLLDLIAGLTSRLEEVKRSLSTQDWSALADVLAYDLSEQAERWTAMLRSLAESLRK